MLVGLEEKNKLEGCGSASQLHCMLCSGVLGGDSSDGSRDSYRVGGDGDFFDSVSSNVSF